MFTDGHSCLLLVTKIITGLVHVGTLACCPGIQSIRVLLICWLRSHYACVYQDSHIRRRDYVNATLITCLNLGLLSWHSIHQSPAYLLAPKPLCVRVPGFTHSQTRLCQRYFDHMPVISIGAKLGIYECQKQFKFRHWNCSSNHEESAFGPVTLTGSREASFAHAISAAGVVHALSRSCKQARLYSCGCSQADRPEKLHRDWIWGGCGDNIAYAYRFAKAFIDVREKEKSYPRHSSELARMLMNLHNNRAGRLAVYKLASVACKCHGVSGSCSMRTCWTQLSPFPRVGSYLRQSYDEAIKAVYKLASVACKCHGVSGSCSMRTCWTQLSPFPRVGSYLRQSYDEAIKVKFNRRGTKLRRSNRQTERITPDHLTYLDESPDYCNHDPIGGIPGTRDRECIPDSTDGTSCAELCCNRGSRVLLREVKEKCYCQFHWCCRVECKTCIRTEEYHVCN
ncbi:hypothetical protein AHF37_00939 [Paragonimus kellicotti]|nr:hypothetical protein AHF37_00939 [Paragonimus kellicotti]